MFNIFCSKLNGYFRLGPQWLRTHKQQIRPMCNLRTRIIIVAEAGHADGPAGHDTGEMSYATLSRPTPPYAAEKTLFGVHAQVSCRNIVYVVSELLSITCSTVWPCLAIVNSDRRLCREPKFRRRVQRSNSSNKKKNSNF